MERVQKHTNRLARRTGFPAALAVLGAVLGACGGGGGATPSPAVPNKPRPATLTRVTGCEDLDARLTDLGVDLFAETWRNGGYGVASGGGPLPPDGAGLPADAGNETADRSGETALTTTNTQEIGVDEPDLVKAQGDHLFVLQQGAIHVVDAWPPEEAHEIARVAVEGWGESLLLAGSTLIAFTSIYEGGYDPVPLPGVPEPLTGEGDILPPEEPPGETFQAVRITLVDVQDPAAPVVRRTLDVEGSLVGARLVDGKVYLVAQHYAGLWDATLHEAIAALGLPDPWALSEAQRDARLPEVRARVRPVIANWIADRGHAALLPDLRVDGGERRDLLACDSVFVPEATSDLALLCVLGFDPAADEDPTGVGVLANGWTLYASQQSLAVVQDSRWWWWGNGESPYAETHVHLFDLNGGAPTYAASGKVPGWTLNSFSMSEHEGHLRIATTDQTFGGWWWGPVAGGNVAPDAPVGTGVAGRALLLADDEPSAALDEPLPDANNVFVLERRGGALEIVGEVRQIAPGEQIRAVRFLGDTGYVVTFLQTDPLFVIDLSDPLAPRITGELHVTGYSTYLHPFGDDHLIGVGREATPEGRVLGLQLQIFDVSDPADPMRIHQEVLGSGMESWSWSEAEHDHHAFTFHEARNLLALPITMEDWNCPREDYCHFSGIVVYEVSAESGFAEIGRVSHTGLVTQDRCKGEEGAEPSVVGDCDVYALPWAAWMRRSVFRDDVLYAISDHGLTASRLEALDEPVANIAWD